MTEAAGAADGLQSQFKTMVDFTHSLSLTPRSEPAYAASVLQCIFRPTSDLTHSLSLTEG